MVEKRYRTNLNHKIAALRDSIPSLRVLDKDNSCSEDSLEDLERLSQVKKLNKVISPFILFSYILLSSFSSSIASARKLSIFP